MLGFTGGSNQHTFAVFGGVLYRGIHVNMMISVGKVRLGKGYDVNAWFATMVGHYLFEAEAGGTHRRGVGTGSSHAVQAHVLNLLARLMSEISPTPMDAPFS